MIAETTANARPIPLDPSLPWLGEMLAGDGPPGCIADLGEKLGGDRTSAELVGVRYRPHRQCVALWSFPNAATGRVLISGRMFRDDKGARIVRKDSFRQLVERTRATIGGGTTPYRYVSDRKLLVQAFPLDVEVPALALAAANDWIRPRLSPALGLTDRDVCSVEIDAYRYTASRRCVLRYSFETRKNPIRYFGKVFRDGRGDRLNKMLHAISVRLRRSQSPWQFAIPVAYIPSANMLLFEEIENGVNFNLLLQDASECARAERMLAGNIALAAKGLARFQKLASEGQPRKSPQALLGKLEKKVEEWRLPDIAPALAPIVDDCLRRLGTRLARLRTEAMVPSHGAFRHQHLLFSKGKMVVLDADGISISGASADVGEFLACLDIAAVGRSPRKQRVMENCRQSFVAAMEGEGETRPDWIAWYRAASHVKNALRSVSSIAPGWPEKAEQRLDLARNTLGETAGPSL